MAPELGRPLNQGQTITREEILARLNDPSLCSSTSCRKRRLRTGISLARSTCRCLKSKPRHASFFPMSQGELVIYCGGPTYPLGKQAVGLLAGMATKISATTLAGWPIGRKRAADRKNRFSRRHGRAQRRDHSATLRRTASSQECLIAATFLHQLFHQGGVDQFLSFHPARRG